MCWTMLKRMFNAIDAKITDNAVEHGQAMLGSIKAKVPSQIDELTFTSRVLWIPVAGRKIS